VYDGDLVRNLINYTIEFLKMIVSIISDGYTRPKSDGHGHGYKFLPVSMIMGGYWLQLCMWLREDISNIRS
jgi:hypothetical protein